MSRAQNKSAKSKKASEFLKKHGKKRECGRCSVCGRVISLKELQSHVSSCNGRR